MAMENKRIIQLSTERTTLGDDDYTIVDSDTNGTAKYRLSRLKETDTTLSVSGMAADAAATGQAISDEATARGNAVAAEAEARAAADTTLGNDVDDLKSALSKLNIIESLNKLSNIETGHFYNKSGSHQKSSSYNCSGDIIPVTEGDIVRFYADGELSALRFVTAYNNGSAISASGSENISTYTVPNGINGIRVSWNSNSNRPMLTINYEALAYVPYFHPYYVATSDFLGEYIKGWSENVLDSTSVTNGKFINKSGGIGTSNNYAVTDYISVKENNLVVMTTAESSVETFRYVTAYNSQKNPISSKGAENVSSYTVPSGVSFIRLSVDIRFLYQGSKTARVNTDGIRKKWQPFFSGGLNDFSQKGYTLASNLYNYPIASLPSYIRSVMAYRPLGGLSKGYICLVSDDGDAELATYTIPMLQAKGDVPCTFAVMKSSECWNDDTNKATVINAVTNHGCEIAQHGGRNWTNYDEYTLNNFFDSEASYWESLGLTAYGAVCPEHGINDMIRIVAGGRFGCVRTGYSNANIYYGNYCNGARNNIFGLTSQSSVDSTLADQKEVLDACKDNHWLRMIHWHENELTTETKAQLEGIIDYAISIGLTFITMKDIPIIT